MVVVAVVVMVVVGGGGGWGGREGKGERIISVMDIIHSQAV